MWIQKDNILCHCVLDEELLEVPEPKVGDFRHFCASGDKNVAGLEVAVHHWTSHVVQACNALTTDQRFYCLCCNGVLSWYVSNGSL